jgi:hypothetical protein
MLPIINDILIKNLIILFYFILFLSSLSNADHIFLSLFVYLKYLKHQTSIWLFIKTNLFLLEAFQNKNTRKQNREAISDNIYWII